MIAMPQAWEGEIGNTQLQDTKILELNVKWYSLI